MRQKTNAELTTPIYFNVAVPSSKEAFFKSYRGFSQVSVGLLLISSAMLSRAVAAESTVDPLPEADSATLSELMQAAQNAKQAAQGEAARLEANPAISAKGIPSTNLSSAGNNANGASIALNGVNTAEITQAPSDAEAAAANKSDEQQADAELDKAREESQISNDSAVAISNKATEDNNTSPKAETANPSGSTATNTDTDTPKKAEEKKPNVFKRLWYRFRPLQEDLAAALPTIDVVTVGAPELLSKNVKGKLEQYTVEAFSDFRASLPQLRSMAKEAAEAVGYYNAVFRFEQIDSDSLRVIITPNQPVIVKHQDIDFTGQANEDKSFTDIKANPNLKIGDQMNDQLYEQTKGKISSTATEKGYFDGYWNIHDVKVTLPENAAHITLDYDSGERYKLGKVEFRNTNPDKPLPVDLDLLEKLVPFKENDDYGSWKLNNLSRNLSDTRYFSSIQVETVIPEPIVRPIKLPDNDTVLNPTIEPNNLTEAGAVQVTSANTNGATGVDESQFAGMGNNHLSTQSSPTLKKELSEAERKEIEQKEIAAKVREIKIIPIVVTINSDKPNSAEAGIGYGTDTGVRFRSQYRKALVNSHGHNIDGNLELSQIRQSVDMRYNLPYKHPLDDTISIFGGFEQEEKGTIGEALGLSTQSVTMGAERAIKPRNGDWQHTISVRYRLDQLKRETNSSTDPADLPPPFNITNSRFEQQSLLFGYGINKVYTSGGRIDPPRAFRQFYQIDVGSQNLLTDTDLAILRAGWRFIYSLGENDNHQFVGRADAATIITKDFEAVPYNLRFFAGGDQSIRGYDYKSLSTLQNGYLIGGQNLAVGSLEYNYQFIPKWRGAFFVDAGNAFDKQFNDPIKVGAGFGVRWSSPVGPIRVDIAAGVSESNLPIRLHFFIGPQL